MQLKPIAETSPLDNRFYYVANFETMLRTLQRRDGDLLSAEEGGFIREFFSVPQVSRALLVRMLMRRGPLFRAARLNYREIPQPIAAAQPLLERGWIDPTPTMTLAEVFGIFTKAEVAVRLVVGGFEAKVSKRLLLESLLMRWPDARPLDAWLAPPEPVFKVAVANLCIRLQLMFFGNFRQSLTDFVLATLGIVKYEGTGFEPHSRPFQTRAQVEHFFALYRCRQMLHEDRLPADIEPLLPPPIDGCEWLEDRRQKLHYRLARQYER
ncbi:MAG: VRR-NUC domain-containing protein, partial [Pseudomonadota bacterium]|nr:VRR-NUC domain-containing protein [Pseudomonadota bacterium]